MYVWMSLLQLSQVTSRCISQVISRCASSHLCQVTGSMCTWSQVIARYRKEVIARCRQVELEQGSSWRRRRSPWQQVGEDE